MLRFRNNDHVVTVRGLTRRIRGSLLAHQLFDANFYAQQQARQPTSKAREYLHFLQSGWQSGLNPNSWFSCSEYLKANPDIDAADLNPWLHFVRSGRFENRPLRPLSVEPTSTIGPLTLEETLARAASTLVDPVFYAVTNSDFQEIGLTAADHFMQFGWREGRIPAPWFDNDYMSNHAPVYRPNSGNSLTELLRITTGAPAETKAPESFWVDHDRARIALDDMPRKATTMVVLHAYYPDDLDNFSSHLSRLPPHSHLVITCPVNGYEVCRRWAARNDLSTTIIETVNRGRDWGPFLAVAQEIDAPNAGAFLKLHTKRSPHREDGSVWLEQVLDGLLPSNNAARDVASIFHNGECDILAAPGTLSWAVDWKPNRPNAQRFYEDIGTNEDFEFPAGSMFWLSPRLLKELSALDITISDYEPELGQLDGTLAHALERAVAQLTPTAPGLVPQD